MKILTVLGARPQFIKAATISRAIKDFDNVNEIIVHTGQHFDKGMSDIFFEEMDIPKPDYNLEINSLGHGAMTGRMLEKIEEIILKEDPDYLLVYGDTNSTLAGALAAKKLHKKVVHIEAGLRSFNMKMPEEINRILTDRISDYLFCPTDSAIENLKKEGFDQYDCKVIKSGDVMYDAALFYSQKSETKSTIVKDLNLNKNFILVTCHRAENTDDEKCLRNIFEALNEVNKTTQVVLPLHPRTKKMLEQYNIKFEGKSIEPVGYFDMISLLKNCSLVVTDSGGLQKEAFFFSKYCVTMREQTEWVELVENGFNILSGSNNEKIIESTRSLLKKIFPENPPELYGDGKSAEFIIDKIKNSNKN